MKKITSLLLVFMLLFSLAACDEDLAGSHTDPSQSDNKDNNKKEISFSELVAVDNDDCMIKINGIDPDNLWGYTLKVQLENKSAEKTYMYTLDSAAINGVQCSPLFATKVAAGKKSNDEIRFSTSELDDHDVGDYTDIELTFRVYDSNDLLADEVVRKTVHVYPYGEDKAVNFVRESKDTDNVIIDNDNVTVIVTGYKDDAIWGYTVKLFLINKTDKDVMFSVQDASVNGYMVDLLYATKVTSGKCAFSSILLSNSSLEDNNITTVEKIEFNLRAYDSHNWFGDDFANETITLKP